MLGRKIDNFAVWRADPLEALWKTDPQAAVSEVDPTDHEGLAIRAACNLIGAMRDPPVAGKDAIRAALRNYLTGLFYWPAELPNAKQKQT